MIDHPLCAPSRQMKRGGWYWLDKAVIRHFTPKVGLSGIAVYNALASMVDTRQTCFPSQGYIATVLGCSRTTVMKAINALVQHRLVVIEKGQRYPQLYRLLAPPCPESASALSTFAEKPAQNLDTNKNQ